MPDDELIERIAAVDPTTAETMGSFPPEFSWQSLPFYRNFELLIATVKLRHRVMEFHYADDGSRLCILRATPEHVYAVNELESLELDAEQVPEYLRFFFDNVTGPRISPVERADEVEWLQQADSEPELQKRKQQAEPLILQPMRVTSVDENRYQVALTAVADVRLMEVDLVVSRNGHVDIENQRILFENLPVVEVFP